MSPMTSTSPACRAEALTTGTARRREGFRGVGQIVRLNWPFYAGAAIVIAVTMAVVPQLGLNAPARLLVYGAAGAATFWLAGSLVVSWVIYDRSNLMTGEWIPGALGFRPATWINIHAGLDETTPALRELFRGSSGRVFDIFDPLEMTEPSIARARRLSAPDPDTERVDFRRLPARTASADAVLLLLSAHELRTEPARVALFTEIRRALAPGGRVVVAEHLRDGANFAGFGPGFLHFHSRRTWRRSFMRAGVMIHREFSITPFIRVFVLAARGESHGLPGLVPGELT